MRNGDRVIISGAAGIVAGELVDVRPVAKLPDLAGLRELSKKAREILEGDEFKRVAVLSHMYGGWQVTFVAFEDRDGKWFDIKGNHLQIEPVGRDGA